MFVVKSIRNRHIFFIPAILAGFITTNQKNCAATRIKSIEYTIWPATVLNSQLTHIAMTRGRYVARVWKTQLGTKSTQQFYSGTHRFLFSFTKPIPPLAELISILNFPFHGAIIPIKIYAVKGMFIFLRNSADLNKFVSSTANLLLIMLVIGPQSAKSQGGWGTPY